MVFDQDLLIAQLEGLEYDKKQLERKLKDKMTDLAETLIYQSEKLEQGKFAVRSVIGSNGMDIDTLCVELKVLTNSINTIKSTLKT